MPVIGLVLAAAPQRAADTSVLSGSHVAWGMLLVGVLIGLFAPAWLAWLVALVALVGLGAFQAVTVNHGSHVHAGGLIWLFIFAVGGIAGMIYGRIRGLRHLGESEFRTRWGNIRRISRF